MANEPDEKTSDHLSIPAPVTDNLVVCQLFRGTEGGGIITAVNQWAPLMRDAGWDMKFIVMSDKGKAVDMLRNAGLDPVAVRFGRFDRFTKLPKRLRCTGARIIHVHNPSAQLAATLAARRARAEVFRTVHADMFEEMKGSLPGWKIAFWKRMVAWLIKKADGVAVVSPHLIPLLPALASFDRTSIRVMPNGYDAASIDHDRTPLPDNVRSFLGDGEKANGTENDHRSPMILSMGRLVSVKNFQLLLKALKRQQQNIPDVKLVLAGSGPLESDLKVLAQQLSIQSSVLFLPWVDQIAPLLKRANVVVLSSLSECCPMLILEAMSAARPVVSTNVGGVPHMIENERNGLLVPSGDEGQLADAIGRILNDEELADKLGRQNHAELLRRFSPHASAHALACVYNEIAANLS